MVVAEQFGKAGTKVVLFRKKDILVEPERHPVWKQLGESDVLRRQKYRQIINNEKEATSEEPDFKDLKNGIVGDDEFRKSLRNSLGRLIPRKPGRR
jgi:hypothetical protein